MMNNTYEHGYYDAVSGRQRVLGSDEYREGYVTGQRYMRSQKAIELVIAGIIGITIGIGLVAWLMTRLPVQV